MERKCDFDDEKICPNDGCDVKCPINPNYEMQKLR